MLASTRSVPTKRGNHGNCRAFPSSDRSALMRLESEFIYRVKTTGPLPDTKGSPRGERLYWIVSEAELEGARIRAKLAAPGSDWMNVSNDGFWLPDVRLPFVTDDGATILTHYTGLVEQTAAFKKAAETDRPPAWDDQYMRLMKIRYRCSALPVVQHEPVRGTRAPAWHRAY